MTIETKINKPAKLISDRGLEPKGRNALAFATLLAREMDSYVPFRTGTLKNQRLVEPGKITYTQPYATFQYYGKVMVDPDTGKAAFFSEDYGFWSRPGVAKVVTDRDLTYNGAPQRGAFWDVRCWKERGKKITQQFAAMIDKTTGGGGGE